MANFHKADMEKVGEKVGAMYQFILNVFFWNDWGKVTYL